MKDFDLKKYIASEIAFRSGVSVRTLRYYDEIGLLKPSYRTDKGYRWYGSNELFRLQQILLYKELGFSLKDIKSILDDPSFDILKALHEHKEALKEKAQHVSLLLKTIDNTIKKLQGESNMTIDDLYKGFPENERKQIREEAFQKYGDEIMQTSEKYLKTLSKKDFNALVEEQKYIFKSLFEHHKKDPKSSEVQQLIHKHYLNIRAFWGTADKEDNQFDQYLGLGQLYIDDPRFTKVDGEPQPAFSVFLKLAMEYYIECFQERPE